MSNEREFADFLFNLSRCTEVQQILDTMERLGAFGSDEERRGIAMLLYRAEQIGFDRAKKLVEEEVAKNEQGRVPKQRVAGAGRKVDSGTPRKKNNR